MRKDLPREFVRGTPTGISDRGYKANPQVELDAPLHKRALIDALTRPTARSMIDPGLGYGNMVERTTKGSKQDDPRLWKWHRAN